MFPRLNMQAERKREKEIGLQSERVLHEFTSRWMSRGHFASKFNFALCLNAVCLTAVSSVVKACEITSEKCEFSLVNWRLNFDGAQAN